jgi:hypothetical protein
MANSEPDVEPLSSLLIPSRSMDSDYGIQIDGISGTWTMFETTGRFCTKCGAILDIQTAVAGLG